MRALSVHKLFSAGECSCSFVHCALPLFQSRFCDRTHLALYAAARSKRWGEAANPGPITPSVPRVAQDQLQIPPGVLHSRSPEHDGSFFHALLVAAGEIRTAARGTRNRWTMQSLRALAGFPVAAPSQLQQQELLSALSLQVRIWQGSFNRARHNILTA
eukprot:6482003-Amphidinium_carterae.2